MLKDESLENDRVGDMLIEGDRAGVTISDGQGEDENVAERPGESLTDGILFFSGINCVPQRLEDMFGQADNQRCLRELSTSRSMFTRVNIQR